jgi:adenylate cyclase
LISSKVLMAKTGISRATLNNYIGLGLLSKPEIRSGQDGEKLLGYFPESAIDRVMEIQSLKAQGLGMSQIRQDLAAGHESAVAVLPDSPPSAGGSVQLTLDQVAHPAYMFNYRFELTWFNAAAQQELLGNFDRLPAESEGRHLLPMLLAACQGRQSDDRFDLIRANLSLIRQRLSKETLLGTLTQVPLAQQQLIGQLYDQAPQASGPQAAAAVIPLDLPSADGRTSPHQLIATYFREGVFVVCAPAHEAGGSLAEFLSRRDVVIRHLLKKRLPVLTPLAVLVTDLQGSTRICSELPPEEYFELINEIWSSMEPIFRKYFGTHGKHVGDGMVYYFFPQPDSNYLFNAVAAGIEIREEMRQINSRWRQRKGWFNDLYMNTGLHEGTEWLGTFQSATSIEFSVLGDTINQASRLSDFARFGSIWATKHLIGKLSSEDRDRLVYGVNRTNHEGRQVFIERTFAQIEDLKELAAGDKSKDIATLAVAEIARLNG